MRINVANDFAQPIFQPPLQIHILLGMHRGENAGFEMPKVHFCRTNPRLALLWHGWSTVAEELLPPKQLCNPEKAISIAGARTDAISRVKALIQVSQDFLRARLSFPWTSFQVFSVGEYLSFILTPTCKLKLTSFPGGGADVGPARQVLRTLATVQP